jgi:hypothetical protein
VVAPDFLRANAPLLSYAFSVITATWLGIDALEGGANAMKRRTDFSWHPLPMKGNAAKVFR